MESPFRTRILLSPSLSAQFPFSNGVTVHGVDCGVFTPFPPLLPDQTGASTAISFSSSDYSFHPFVMIDQVDQASISRFSGTTSFNIDSSRLIQLPNLLSLEPLQDPFMERSAINITRGNSVDNVSIFTQSTPAKRPRACTQYLRSPPILPLPYQQLVDWKKYSRHEPSQSSTERSRQRRQLISDRTRILEKLMPWERRMDTGTMLEEAFKYVKFLQAQVTILESMPATSGFLPATLPPGNAMGNERLTRQQLLQVMVNSAIVQDMLCKKGFCIVSAEQVALLRQSKERRMQPFLFLGLQEGA